METGFQKPEAYLQEFADDVEKAEEFYDEERRLAEEETKKLRLEALARIADRLSAVLNNVELLWALRENSFSSQLYDCSFGIYGNDKAGYLAIFTISARRNSF